MITPNCRVQFTADDMEFITSALGEPGSESKSRALIELLGDPGSRDVLLDNEQLLAALLEARGCLKVSSHCYFYILVRHALRRAGIPERDVADYVAEVLAEFSIQKNTELRRHPESEPIEYFFEMASVADAADDLTRFHVRAHMGNQSLFMTGVFPERIRHRAESRGFPDLSYYEAVGRTSFKEASHHRLAERYHLSEVFDNLAGHFHQARKALNDLADRVFSIGEDPHPIETLLRRVDPA